MVGTPKKATKKTARAKDSKEKPTKGVLSKAKKRRDLFLRAKVKVAERFSNAARQKLGSMVKGVAVIGSIARGDFKPGSDIDVLVVLDDTQRDVPDELKEKMLAMLNDIGKKIDKKMQVQIHTITEMFQFLKEGDNIVYNFVRHMKIVYDGGILKPLKKLLKAGEIKPTKESVMRSIEGADFYMKKVKQYVEWIIERYYRAVTWASNAFVMSMNEQPASPPEIPITLKGYSDKGVIPKEMPAIAAEVIKAHKAIEHGDFNPKVEDVYKLEPKVLKFLDVMRKEVIGSVVEEGLKGSIKSKIKTMPKIIYEFEKGKAFAWLLDEGVYVAFYEGPKLSKVYTAKVKKGKVSDFKPVDNDKLFSAMEVSELKPLINKALIKMIYSAMPDEIKRPVKKIAVEYPGRAMIDLGKLE